MSFCSCYLSCPPPAYFPSLVFPSLTHLCFLFPCSFCIFSVSRLIVFAALCFFLLVPPLSHLFWFLLPRPPRALEKENHAKNNYLILFAFWGSLWQCPLHKIIVFCFIDIGGFLLSAEHVLVRCSWNMFWGSKGLFVASYLLLFRCFGVWSRAFFRSNLSVVPAFFGFVLFFCVCVFFWGGGCFCFFRVLLFFLFCLSSSSWVFVSSLLCCRAGLFNFMSWLLVFACGLFWYCHFLQTFSGVVWVWPTGRGQYTFRLFL